MSPGIEVSVEINGLDRRAIVPDRLTLADFLRDHQGLTGTHLGCEQGVCGACTVLVDGRAVRSCLMLAAQAEGARVTTVEGLAPSPQLSELQQAFADHDALQCGFCTPGLLMTCAELLAGEPVGEAAIRSAISGNLCRCTGYSGIVAAVLELQAGAKRRHPANASEAVVETAVPPWATWQAPQQAAPDDELFATTPSLRPHIAAAAALALLAIVAGLRRRQSRTTRRETA